MKIIIKDDADNSGALAKYLADNGFGFTYSYSEEEASNGWIETFDITKTKNNQEEFIGDFMYSLKAEMEIML